MLLQWRGNYFLAILLIKLLTFIYTAVNFITDFYSVSDDSKHYFILSQDFIKYQKYYKNNME